MKRSVFIAKSMMWSLLLYALFMLASNWEDLSNKVRGINPITIVNNITAPAPASAPASVPASISHRTGVLNFVITVASGLQRVAR